MRIGREVGREVVGSLGQLLTPPSWLLQPSHSPAHHQPPPSLRATAASGLARLMRHCPHLVPALFDTIPPPQVKYVMMMTVMIAMRGGNDGDGRDEMMVTTLITVMIAIR